MSDFVTWLLAQLDADEAAAHVATPGPYRIGSDFVGKRYIETHDGDLIAGNVSWEDAPHIARHDPARVLAEVAAKRAIVALHQVVGSQAGRPACYLCSDDYRTQTYPCPTVRALASVYEGAPGWQEEWR